MGKGEVRGEGIIHSCSRKGKGAEAGRNEAERGPGAGRGRKPTAVVVATGTNHPLQQVKALSQRAEAPGMWLQQKSGTGPGLGKVSEMLCHCPL